MYSVKITTNLGEWWKFALSARFFFYFIFFISTNVPCNMASARFLVNLDAAFVWSNENTDFLSHNVSQMEQFIRDENFKLYGHPKYN